MEAYAASSWSFCRGRPGIALYSRGDPYQESYIQKMDHPHLYKWLTATQGLPIGLSRSFSKRQISFKQMKMCNSGLFLTPFRFSIPLLLGPLLCAMPWDTKEKIFWLLPEAGPGLSIARNTWDKTAGTWWPPPLYQWQQTHQQRFNSLCAQEHRTFYG